MAGPDDGAIKSPLQCSLLDVFNPLSDCTGADYLKQNTPVGRNLGAYADNDPSAALSGGNPPAAPKP